MCSNNLISVDDPSNWLNALRLCGVYDIYHLPEYHLLAEKMGEGKPYLFFFQSEGSFAGLPFLLRKISEIEGLEKNRYNDITSVYGYPGIVASLKEDDNDSEKFCKNFKKKLHEIFQELSVVAFFSRTNPLMPNNWMLSGMADILSLSKTVAIDLSKTNDEQISGMTKGHKYDIRKARKNGVVVEEDKFFRYIDDFILIYNQTMKRNDADNKYYFPKDYYLQLKNWFGESIRLYFAKVDGQAISASMFFLSEGIIQYHLSGSLPEFFHLNGAKVILDEVRLWGSQNGFSWLHLGGGVGSSEDSLFRFKAGFSKVRLQFQIIQMIVDQKVYSEICSDRKKWALNNDFFLSDNDFFPDYRRPMIKMGCCVKTLNGGRTVS